jgi:hypothetical protein
MYYVILGFIPCSICYTLLYPIYYMLHVVLSYVSYVIRGFILCLICYKWFYPMIYMLYMVLSYVLSVEDFLSCFM